MTFPGDEEGWPAAGRGGSDSRGRGTSRRGALRRGPRRGARQQGARQHGRGGGTARGHGTGRDRPGWRPRRTRGHQPPGDPQPRSLADRAARAAFITNPGQFYGADPFTFLFASLIVLIFGAGRVSLG